MGQHIPRYKTINHKVPVPAVVGRLVEPEPAGPENTGKADHIGDVGMLVERFDPQRIVLFGSFSRGTPGRDSDADLLVVTPVQGSRRKLAADMELALVGVRLPKDLIVVTPEEVERDRDQIGTIVHLALRDGMGLYER